MFHIHAWNQILNQNQYNRPDCICHLGTPTFHFCLSPFCNGGTVYLENHRMGSTLGLRGNSFLLTGLPSCFSVCHHSNFPLSLLFLCLGCIVVRWGIVIPIYILLQLVCYSEICLLLGCGE